MYTKAVPICSKKIILNTIARKFSTTNVCNESHSCKILVIGGGTGGCSIAAKFCRDLNKDQVIIIEPKSDHYYQPLFTLVGGGIKNLSQSRKPMVSVLPKKAKWLKDEVVTFDPKSNSVTTRKGDIVKYDIMLVAAGLQLNYDKVPGLVEALSTPGSGVCSNYSEKYVDLTFPALQNFKTGNAIFTFPQTAVKCPGAPQKICYIAEDYFRKQNKRKQANIIYNTSLPVIFGVKVYADALWKVCKERDINVNVRTCLTEIKPDKKEAVFQNLDKPEEKTVLDYSVLHVTPPMSTPDVLSKNKDLTNEAGFVDVNKDTLQHVRFPNVFAIGDCSSTPNSKTAAAAACQTPVVYNNIKTFLSGKSLKEVYDGYASCPLVTGYGKCIMAEFDYNLQPLETFPFRQDRELYISYLIKKEFIPILYWQLMLNGYWNGPAMARKIMHLNFR